MKSAEDLLMKLGVYSYTKRHLKLVNDFLDSGSTDAKVLLDSLGGWDETDLKIVENYLKS